MLERILIALGLIPTVAGARDKMTKDMKAVAKRQTAKAKKAKISIDKAQAKLKAREEEAEQANNFNTNFGAMFDKPAAAVVVDELAGEEETTA